MTGSELLGVRPAAVSCGARPQRRFPQPGRSRPHRSIQRVVKASAAGDDKSKKSTKPPARGRKAEDIVKEDVDTPSLSTRSTKPAATTPPRSQPASQTAAVKDNIDQGADTAKDAVDDAAAAAKDTARDTRVQAREQASTVKENVDEGAEAVKEGIDSAAEQISETVTDAERALDEGADRAAAQLDQAQDQLQDFAERAPDQVADAAQQAVDATAEGINAAQRAFERATEPGPPAPFAASSLTNLERNPFEGRPGPTAGEERQVEYYKRFLLYVTAGLDRGFAANPNAVAEVESAVTSLTSATSPVVLSWTSEEGSTTTTLAQLNGTWRLIYSSSFATGNLGGRAPGGGPTVGLIPAQLGQVYQTISAYTARLDNVVELYSRIGLPQLPGLPEREPIVTTLTLRHLYEALGGSTSQITFEDTEVKTTGGFGGWLGKLPELRLPQLPEGLRPSRDARTITFETLYLDDDMRVSRGRNGELRIFLKT